MNYCATELESAGLYELLADYERLLREATTAPGSASDQETTGKKGAENG